MHLLIDFEKQFCINLVKLTKARELVEILLLSVISFIIPFILGQPQILIGIIINFLLARNAITSGKWWNLPLIILPSLGALARGIVFGTFTIYLWYMIPAIWLGNFIFIYSIKLFIRGNIIKAILISSIAKFSIIFIYAFSLVRFSLIPDIFLSSMGIIQFITALLGSSICLLLSRKEISF